jgi:hypothetical protein
MMRCGCNAALDWTRHPTRIWKFILPPVLDRLKERHELSFAVCFTS